MSSSSAQRLEQLQPKPECYRLQTVIGKGCAGAATVYLATHVPSNKKVAIRLLHMEDTDLDWELLQNEVMMHRQLCHDNILSLLSSFVSRTHVWTVMPLMAYGSCCDLIHAHFTEGLPEPVIACILKEVLQALDYIHQRGGIHRCVRASHILISETGQVRLSGLRYSYCTLQNGRRVKEVHQFPKRYVSSLLWASPELLQQNLAGYDSKSDVYSLGITTCELANGVVPFADMATTQMLLEKLEGTMPQLLDRLTVPELQEETSNMVSPYQRTFSQAFHNFSAMCLQTSPSHRPSAALLLQHNFLKPIRRKGGAASLPELLQPVQPLSALTNLPTEISAELDEMTTQLQGMQVQDADDWNFS